MNLKLLKVFGDIINTGSLSKAAEVNHIRQSTVSLQLAQLETLMQTRLIERGSGLATPTDAGRALFEGSKDLLRRWEVLQGEVRTATDTLRGVLRIGTIYSVGLYQLDPYVRQFMLQHPEVNIRLEFQQANRIYAAVISGEIDLGVVAYPEPSRQLVVTPFASDELVVAMAPQHALAQRQAISPAQLSGLPAVGFSPEIPTGRHIDELLAAAGVQMEVRAQFDNVETIKRAVEIGLGLAIVPLATIQKEVRNGTLCYARPACGHKWVRPLGILRRRDGESAHSAQEQFLRMFSQKRPARRKVS